MSAPLVSSRDVVALFDGIAATDPQLAKTLATTGFRCGRTSVGAGLLAVENNDGFLHVSSLSPLNKLFGGEFIPVLDYVGDIVRFEFVENR
jgi:hypothetical protein